MNFLAHLYLSGPPGEVMIGNFIADSVTATQQKEFSPGIQQGILLHRAIDSFTDQHPLVSLSKERLRPRYRKYANVIVDVFYDHFLAREWQNYSEKSLREYADTVYGFLQSHQAGFPQRAARFYMYMVRYDALFNYSRIEGIARVMEGMSRRTSFESGMETCTEELIEHYDLFAGEFRSFFPELVAHTAGMRA